MTTVIIVALSTMVLAVLAMVAADGKRQQRIADQQWRDVEEL